MKMILGFRGSGSSAEAMPEARTHSMQARAHFKTGARSTGCSRKLINRVSGKALAAGTFGNEPTASALSLTTLECGFETGA